MDDRNADIDSECRSVEEFETGSSFSARQRYLSGRLVEYVQSVDATEPIDIEFDSLGELSEINLWINGGIVFGIELKRNIVSSYYYHNDEVEHFEKRINDLNYSYIKRMQPRLKILKQGKKQVESLLLDICQRSEHKKTCEAQITLVGFKYVP